LIFLVVAAVSATFCSRSFHSIRCDFVAAFSVRTALTFPMISASQLGCFAYKTFGIERKSEYCFLALPKFNVKTKHTVFDFVGCPGIKLRKRIARWVRHEQWLARLTAGRSSRTRTERQRRRNSATSASLRIAAIIRVHFVADSHCVPVPRS